MSAKTGKFCTNIVIFTTFLFFIFALVSVHFSQAETSSAIRITNTTMDVTLDPAQHSLAARVAITFIPLQNLSVVSFDLNPALTMNGVTDADGQNLHVERDAGMVRVTSSVALMRGASIIWTFVYGGVFPASAGGTVRLASVGEPVSYLLYAARWFPTSGDPTNRFTASMQVHVPAGEMVFGSGPVDVPHLDANGLTVFDFDWARPGFPGTIIAGKFHQVSSANPDVRVFLIGASGVTGGGSLRGQNEEVLRSPPQQQRPVAGALGSAQDDGLSKDERGASGAKIAAKAAQQYSDFTAQFGSLHSNRLNIIELPEGTLPAVSAPGIAAVAGKQLLGANGARLLVNTIAHQWWGELVSSASLDDSWITNGMCRYLELEFVKKKSDPAVFADALLNVSAGALAYDSVPLSRISQYQEFSPQFEAMTYDKGGMIFRMLRWQIGDAAFTQTLRGILSLPNQSVSSADVERIAEAESHQNLRPFFTEWLDSTGAPALKDSWTLYRLGDNKGYRTVGEIGQDLDLFRMPVEVRLSTAEKTIDQRVDVSGTQTQFVVETPEIPKTIVIDPERWLLRNSPDMQVRVHILRGQNFAAQNDDAAAIREYRAALGINDVSSLASYRLGEVYFSQKNYQAAANAFRDALHGDGVPKWTEVWSDVQLGKIFDATGQRERAVNQYREALATGDDTGGAVELARGYIGKAYTPVQ